MLLNIIKDSISTLSILLVFVVLYYSLLINEYNKIILLDLPNGAIALRKLKNKYITFLLIKIIPFTLLEAGIFYLFLPTSLKVIKETKFTLWNFDINLTAFIIIEIFISSILIVLIFFIFKIVLRIREVLKKL